MYIYSETKQKIYRWIVRGFIALIAAAALTSFVAIVYISFSGINKLGWDGFWEYMGLRWDLVAEYNENAIASAENLFSVMGDHIVQRADALAAALAEFAARIAANF